MKWPALFRARPLDKAFFITIRWYIQFLSYDPSGPANFLSMLKLVVNMSILATAVIGEFNLFILARNDLLEALQGLCPCITKFVTWIKLVIFIFIRHDLSAFLGNIYNTLKTDIQDSRKKVVIEKACIFSNFWPWLIFLFGMATAGFFAFLPLGVWIYKNLTGEHMLRPTLPFAAALPYKDMTRITSDFVYGSIYLFLAYSGVVTVLGYTTADGSFMVFAIFLIAMTDNLRNDFEEAFRRHGGHSDLESDNSDALYREMIELVKRQQLINNFIQELNRLYKYQVVIQFIQAGIVLGVASVNFLWVPGAIKATYVTYAITSIIQPYSYCYGADGLDRCTFNLSETIYFLEWYKFDKKVRRLVLFAIMRTQTGNPIVVPFFNPSFPLLSAILRASASYITMLRTFS